MPAIFARHLWEISPGAHQKPGFFLSHISKTGSRTHTHTHSSSNLSTKIFFMRIQMYKQLACSLRVMSSIKYFDHNFRRGALAKHATLLTSSLIKEFLLVTCKSGVPEMFAEYFSSLGRTYRWCGKMAITHTTPSCRQQFFLDFLSI